MSRVAGTARTGTERLASTVGGMTANVLEGVLEAAGARLDDAIELRRRIHRRPELGLELPETQAAVLEALDGLPLAVTTGTSTTSVVAVLDGDAPGPDGAAARRHGRPADAGGHRPRVRRARSTAPCTPAATTPTSPCSPAPLGCSPSAAGDIAGRVAFMFQPGEEGHHGARFMLEEGLLAQARRRRPSRCRWPSPSTRRPTIPVAA